MTEPLPCPFCGHVGLSHSEGSTFRWLLTECNGCGAQCGEERINTMAMERSAAIEQAKVEAIKTWNTRAALEQQQADPVQEPVACRFCFSEKGCWTWQCYHCGEIDDVQQPAPPQQPEQEPTPWRDMVVVSLVREGIDKHKARELADHFAAQQQAEPVSMRMPKVGDKVICLEDESFGEVVSLTGGGSPDITFDDGTRGTYLLREFAELFGYVAAPQQQAEPVAYFDFQELKFTWAKHMKIGPVPVSIKVDPMKLYSEAPQRQWVGLTDEDMKDPKTHILDFIYGARWAEAKLKERNT